MFQRVGLFIAGVACWAAIAFDVAHYVQLAKYQPVRGQVLSSDVVRIGKKYAPEIEYAYSVNDRAFTGKIYNPVDQSGTETWAESVAGTYLPGFPCTVYIHAARPESSALSIQPRQSDWILLGLGALIGLIAIIFALFPILAPHKRCRH